MKHPEAFPALARAIGDASRWAYGSIPVTGASLARAYSGRTPTAAITDHPHRAARALEYALRSPQARAELKALLESYEA